MNDQTHTEGNEHDENENSGFSDDVSRRGMITRVGTVGAIAATGGISLAVGSVRAQTGEQETWEDDFEDGNIDGWGGIPASISTETFNGDNSLETYDNHTEGDQLEWVDGPVLNVSEPFDVTGISKSNLGDQTNPIRYGLFTGFLEGLLLFHDPRHGSGITYLAGQAHSPGEIPHNVDTIDDDFHDEWVRFRINSVGDGSIRAKVWLASNEEPADYQFSFESDSISALFAIEPGSGDENRVYNLDEITIEGEEVVSEFLELDVPTWIDYGQTADYTVVWEDEETGDRENVTEDATVISPDTDVITVDGTEHTVTATDDTEVSERIRLRAEYSEAEAPAFANVTVASIDMENIDILPPWRRIQATLGDKNVGSIIVAIMGGIIGSHFASAFAGLGFATIITVVLWFGGWLDTGFAMVALFLSLFIGLNLAANIDYTMQR